MQDPVEDETSAPCPANASMKAPGEGASTLHVPAFLNSLPR